MIEIGKVETIMRFPVKSMQGEQLAIACLTEEGISGDRKFALRDRETGHIASAKHPRKWERLIQCRAYYRRNHLSAGEEDSLCIDLPDNTTIESNSSNTDTLLSHFLGRDVSLVSHSTTQEMREADRTPLEEQEQSVIQNEPLALAAPKGKFFDYAPMHLITDSSLRKLASLYPEGDFHIHRFRPNVLIKLNDRTIDFVENAWLGKSISIGDEVLIRIMDPTPRCLVPTLSQAALSEDRRVLKTIVKHNAVASYTLAPGVVFKGVLGVYAQIDKPGIIRQGDVVKISE